MKPTDLKHCPDCGSKIGQASEKGPGAGDIIVCSGCTAFLRFAPDLALYKMPKEELKAISDREVPPETISLGQMLSATREALFGLKKEQEDKN